MAEAVFLTTVDAAARIGLSPSTLEKKRCNGGGPPFIRHPGGKRVVYAVSELDSWVRSKSYRSTSEYDTTT